MDQSTVSSIVSARSRDDLKALSAAVLPLAGGSHLFGEQTPDLTGLVDLLSLGWPALEVRPKDDEATGLIVGATCTIAELSRLLAEPGWNAHPLFYQLCTALYGSFKIWNVATVGGNICTSLPAGPMTSLAAALDAELVIWRADGTDERMPVTEFITGNKTNVLNPGDVLRSVQFTESMLRSHTAYRKIALSPLGRSGSVLIGRRDEQEFVLTVTAGTVRPVQLRFDTIPTADELHNRIASIDLWFTDAHGAADWRRAVSQVLGEEIRAELYRAELHRVDLHRNEAST
jgi:CO/xanthine dehydrogenase FAD-binding subunit